MDETKERINVQISDQELERRWKEIRVAMAPRKIDVLLMQNTNQFLGGYVKWFTDVPAFNGYPTHVIFPKDDDMAVINIGPKMETGSSLTNVSSMGGAYRGVRNCLTAPYFPSLHYSKTYDADLVVEKLRPLKGCTIGLVNLCHIPVGFYEYLRTQLTEAAFIDATDLVDEVKAVKSEDS